MKQKLLLMFIVALLPLAGWSADKAYAVFDKETGQMTFYYGEMPSGDNVYEVEDGAEQITDWEFREEFDPTSVSKIVFDSSFEEFKPSMVLWFHGLSSLTEIEGLENLDTSEATKISFYNCSNLESLDLSHFNTSNVTRVMFQGCSSLTSLDLSSFDTSKVTTMASMFKDCSNLESITIDNYKFKTDLVETMYDMFYGCNKLTSLDVSSFNTEKVTTMLGMFEGCSSLTSLNVSGFNTANVTHMGSMFDGCSNLSTLDVSHFNTANVTGMNGMFHGCSKLSSLDVSGFDTGKVTNMLGMFRDCSGLTSLNVSQFNTANVTGMASMFYGCSHLTNLDVSNFNTEKVTSMNDMFHDCSGLTILNVSNFNTGIVTYMGGMFYGCSGLTSLELSNFNTSNVELMSTMFWACSNLETIYVSTKWSTDKVEDGSSTFGECNSLVGGQGTAFSITCVDYDYARIDGGTNFPGYLTGSGNIKVLNDGDDASGLTNDWAGDVIFNRTFTAGKNHTVCLPFAQTALLSKGMVFYFSGITDNKMVMTQISAEETLTANTPYIFQPTSDITSIVFSEVTINKGSDPKTTETDFTFQGTYTAKTWEANDADLGTVYGFTAKAADDYQQGQFAKLKAGANIKPFRAYLKYTGDGTLNDDKASTRGFESLPETIGIIWVYADGTTSISNAITEQQNAVHEGWYSLDGRKLNSKPVKKGIYVNNGRKVIIK